MGRVGNIETLKEEILNQAKEQASTILEREQRIAERDLSYAKEDAEKIREQQRAKSQSMVETENKKFKSAAEMETRKMLLEKKDELVSRLFDIAETRLEGMRGSKTYIGIVTRSIKDAVSNIGNDLIIEYGQKDSNIFKNDVISSIQSSISKSLGTKVSLDFVVSNEDISAGVIIKSKDKRMMIDSSFPSLLRKLKEDMRGKVSEILLKE